MLTNLKFQKIHKVDKTVRNNISIKVRSKFQSKLTKDEKDKIINCVKNTKTTATKIKYKKDAEI